MNKDEKELQTRLKDKSKRSDAVIITEYFQELTGLKWEFKRNSIGKYDGYCESTQMGVGNVTVKTMREFKKGTIITKYAMPNEAELSLSKTRISLTKTGLAPIKPVELF